MAKRFTILLGVVLLAVGVWGMLGGGHDHLLVVFGVNAPHNWVHVLSGGIGLLAGLAGARTARAFLIGFGIVYGLVTVCGFLGVPYVVRMLNLNTADNFLHLAISVACLWVGSRRT